jgi:WD40 repeat protein
MSKKSFRLLLFAVLVISACQPNTQAADSISSTATMNMPVLATPSPSPTDTNFPEQEVTDIPGSISSFQPITAQNADHVSLLRTLEIPGYEKARVSQCSVNFSPDGSRLVGACGSNPVPVWDVNSGQLMVSLDTSSQPAVACDFSPEGRNIACGGFDAAATIWDAWTGEKVGEIPGNSVPIWDLAFNPVADQLALASLGWAAGGKSQGDIRLWGNAANHWVWIYSESRENLSLAFDPLGKRIAFGAMGGRVVVLDAARGEVITELTDARQNIGDLSFSPSGRWLAAGSDNRHIYIWETSNYGLLKSLLGHEHYVNGVAFSPDETWLVSGSHDKTVRIWDLSAGNTIATLSGHEDAVLRVAVSPDGSLIASISWDGTVRLWGVDLQGSSEAQTTAPVLSFQLKKSSQAFTSPETYQAAFGDLDADGDLDAVFANQQRNYSQVWLNDGEGNLVDTSQQLTQYGHGVGVADFDHDGDLDAFIACHFFTTGSKVYLNDGAGALADSGQDLEDASMSANDLNLLDVDGDGDTDVHVVFYDPQGLPDRVYLNDGRAHFRDSGLALDEEVIAWGDMDGDGDVDYFGKQWGKGYVVKLNDGSGQFEEVWQWDDPQSTLGAVALADFDGDGDLDALVTNGFRQTGSAPSYLFWNDGYGQFSDSGQQPNGTVGSDLAVGDLDLDGDLDVFVTNMDLPNEVWINEGGLLLDSGMRLGEKTDMTGKPTMVDVDADGDLDVFVGRFKGGAELWINTLLD